MLGKGGGLEGGLGQAVGQGGCRRSADWRIAEIHRRGSRGLLPGFQVVSATARAQVVPLGER